MSENKRYPRNYLHIRSFSLLYSTYAYIDLPEYLADGIFAAKGVRMKFKEEMKHPDSPYIFIFCKVRKADEQRFLDALEMLHDKMLICGHRDYCTFCENIIGRLIQFSQCKDSGQGR